MIKNNIQECTRCKTSKNISEFFLRKDRPSGLQPCKKCKSELNKLRWAKKQAEVTPLERQAQREKRERQIKKWNRAGIEAWRGKSKYKTKLEKKEAIREQSRRCAKKRYQLNPKKSYQYYKEYWKNTTLERKLKRKRKRTRNSQEWRKKNPDKAKEYHRKNKLKWTNGVNCLDREVWERAERVAVGFIKGRGFDEVMLAPFKQFLYDILAKKDGQICCFQVTTLRTRLIKLKHIKLARYFGWKYFIIHVKPTFSEIYLKEINLNQDLKNKNGIQLNCCKSEKYIIDDR